MLENLSLVQVASNEQVVTARQLFTEYAAGLGFSLCFQNFDQEVAELPGKYSPPSGRLLLALVDERIAGCIGLRKLDEETCEMKRLFLRPEFRGKGLGRELVSAVLNEARTIGYKQIRLDTLPGKMDSAIALYRTIGFHDIPPYYNNPVEGATFMELAL